MVAIEDERFYEHRGVDYQGIARAACSPTFMPGGSTQGASTITQQFVKNALEAQSSRTYFQKLREASYAYHLERQWDKDKILTQYLNTIYFGEGAYGIEAAARTYFGFRYPGCGEGGADPCAAQLAPEEAAMLAGIISSPSAYSPRANPNDAGERRNLVLQKMNEQDVLSDEEYEEAARQALPAVIRDPEARGRLPRPLLHRVAATAARGQVRPRARIRRRPRRPSPPSTSTCRRPPSRPPTTPSPASSRPHPWS